jgi:hypothetical protein
MSTHSIAEIVRRMAREHFEIEENVESIIWFKDERKDEIHLLEVNRESPQEDLILTFYHAPTEEYPIPAIVGDITPEEWEKVKKGIIPLPKGWSLSNIEIFERERILQPQDSTFQQQVE